MDKLIQLKKMIEEAPIEDVYKVKALQIVEAAISRGSITEEEKSQLKGIMQLGEEISSFLENEHIKAADALGAYANTMDKAATDTQDGINKAVAEGEEELEKLIPVQQ